MYLRLEQARRLPQANSPATPLTAEALPTMQLQAYVTFNQELKTKVESRIGRGELSRS